MAHLTCSSNDMLAGVWDMRLLSSVVDQIGVGISGVVKLVGFVIIRLTAVVGGMSCVCGLFREGWTETFFEICSGAGVGLESLAGFVVLFVVREPRIELYEP